MKVRHCRESKTILWTQLFVSPDIRHAPILMLTYPGNKIAPFILTKKRWKRAPDEMFSVFGSYIACGRAKSLEVKITWL